MDIDQLRYWLDLQSEVYTRIKVLEASNVLASEVERVWPGICRDLRKLYVRSLRSIFSMPEEDRWRWQNLVYGMWPEQIDNPWGGHIGMERWYIVRNCGEYVEFAPYPEPPEGTFDCANYDYREDAEEARWTYWYAKGMRQLQKTVASDGSAFYVLELFHEGGGRELICAYLPSRG